MPTPEYERTPGEMLRDLNQRIRDTYTSANSRTGFDSIGSTIIVNGGTIGRLDSEGQTVFWAGPLSPNRPDTLPQQAFGVWRDDGTLALSVWDDNTSTYQQFVGVWTRGGQLVVADDATDGNALARPYLSHSFYRARTSDWPSTTSGSFQTIFRSKCYRQHAKALIAVRHIADGSTAGQIQVVETTTATTIGPVSVGTTETETLFGPTAIGTSYMQPLVFEIQVRRTSGGGSIRCEPSYFTGVES